MSSKVPLEELEAAQKQVENLTSELEELSKNDALNYAESSVLRERLDALTRMMGVQSMWRSTWGTFEREQGPSLRQIHERSAQVREYYALSPWMKRGLKLRSASVWSAGMSYMNMPEKPSGSGRMNSGLAAFLNPVNQANVFGDEAHNQRELALGTDGAVFYLFDNATKVGRQIPVSEITDYATDPDYNNEVIAFKRTWTRYPLDGQPPVEQNKWYYCDTYKGPKADSFSTDGVEVSADTSKTIIAGFVNKLPGWTFGWPDGGIAVEWINLYREYMHAGHEMALAKARIAYKVKQESAAGAKNAAVVMANGDGYGQAATMGSGADITALSSAGTGFAFDTGRALIAVVAASLEVSVVALTADPGAAGSSYGSASTLDNPTQDAMAQRRRWQVDFENRILDFIGLEDTVPQFKPLTSATDKYADMQALALLFQSGHITPELYFRLAADVFGVPNAPTKDNGFVAVAKTTDTNTKGSMADGTASGGNGSTQALASATRGKDVTAGGENSGTKNSTRRDVVSKK